MESWDSSIRMRPIRVLLRSFGARAMPSEGLLNGLSGAHRIAVRGNLCKLCVQGMEQLLLVSAMFKLASDTGLSKRRAIECILMRQAFVHYWKKFCIILR